jgi:hypothetical protein
MLSRAGIVALMFLWGPLCCLQSNTGASNVTGSSTNPNKRAKRGMPSTPKEHRPPNISTDLDGDTGSSHNE